MESVRENMRKNVGDLVKEARKFGGDTVTEEEALAWIDGGATDLVKASALDIAMQEIMAVRSKPTIWKARPLRTPFVTRLKSSALG